MRITTGMINAQLTRDVNTALIALAKQQRMISTGRRINEPSDDPSGAARAVTIRSRTSANDQFQRNIGTARARLTAADTTLRSTIDTLQHAQELAIQGANDSNDAVSRQAIGAQMDQILEEVVAFANGRDPDGPMLFGGQETTVAPYTVTRDVNGRITAVTVNPRGIDAPQAAEVAEGLTVVQGVSGNTAFGSLADPSNMFSTLIRARDALNANDPTALRAELDNMQTIQERVTSADLFVGTRLAWLDAIDTRLKDESVSLAESLGPHEGADLAKAVSDLNQIQLFYEAGLAAGAKLLQQSLLDFLR